MFIQPLFLGVRQRTARDAYRVVFVAQVVDVVRFVDCKLGLRGIKCSQEVRSRFAYAEIVFRRAERAEEFRVFPAVCAVAFSCQDIDLVLVKSPEQRLVIVELDDLGIDRTLLQELLQDVDHRAVQDAYLPAV